MSSNLALPSEATNLGALQAASGPARVTTWTRGFPVRHGVNRRNEKYCLPVRSMPAQGSAAHVPRKLLGAGYAVAVVHVTPPSVEE